MRRKQNHLTLRLGLAAAFFVTFVISGCLLIRDIFRSTQERTAYADLVEQVTPAAEAPSAAAGMPENLKRSGPARDYTTLKLDNQDLAAWLIIEGVGVDYPVMYTPGDPEYYLRRAFDGSYAVSGSLFISEGCTPKGEHTIIYGHNMNDSSMFGRLEYYAEEEFARDNPLFFYDVITPAGDYDRMIYEVMGAFYSRVYQTEEQNVFRYYYYTDLSDPAVFQDYIDQVLAASEYDLGITAEYGDRLLTLSTCSYHTEQGRFVVVAREVSSEK